MYFENLSWDAREYFRLARVYCLVVKIARKSHGHGASLFIKEMDYSVPDLKEKTYYCSTGLRIAGFTCCLATWNGLEFLGFNRFPDSLVCANLHRKVEKIKEKKIYHVTSLLFSGQCQVIKMLSHVHNIFWEQVT